MNIWKDNIITVVTLLKEGKTLQEVGNIFGISRERVRQVIKSYAPELYNSDILWGASKRCDLKKKPKYTYQDSTRFRFYKYIEEKESGCIEWIGGKDPNGYGRFSLSGKGDYAHRASYEIFKGPIPTGLCVCHKCDNPRCVNPDHLWLGTQTENIKDRDAKGRHKKRSTT